MPRPPRADEAGGLYHALNRGNLKATIFQKEGDYFAFEKILSEGLELYRVELFSYQLMPNHYHLVLRPLVDGEMSRFMKWVGG
ncbi:MAG: transposase, partial [Gemmataceae bacterium]|nr:transposase [Gemmataceae bacterium]